MIDFASAHQKTTGKLKKAYTCITLSFLALWIKIFVERKKTLMTAVTP
jgi:hypothetical protein